MLSAVADRDRPDLGVAESKSGWTLNDFSARSEFHVKFVTSDINYLAASSE
jgi:hypothetical protein